MQKQAQEDLIKIRQEEASKAAAEKAASNVNVLDIKVEDNFNFDDI